VLRRVKFATALKVRSPHPTEPILTSITNGKSGA
jgi:hypothetical protein